MAGRDIKRKRSTVSLGGTTTPDPPSPALSAVHASGVSAKLIPCGSTVASSVTSSLLLKKNGTDSATANDNNHSKPQMKLPKDDGEVRRPWDAICKSTNLETGIPCRILRNHAGSSGHGLSDQHRPRRSHRKHLDEKAGLQRLPSKRHQCLVRSAWQKAN